MHPTPTVAARRQNSPTIPLALTLVATLLAGAALAQPALLDPATQPKFVNDVPDALAPGFLYQAADMGTHDYYEVGMYQIEQPLGLIDPVTGAPLLTKCFAYGTGPGFPNATYPGRTFIVQKDWKSRCVSFQKYGHPDKITAREISSRSRKLGRPLHCEGPECARLASYVQKLRDEEAAIATGVPFSPKPATEEPPHA